MSVNINRHELSQSEVVNLFLGAINEGRVKRVQKTGSVHARLAVPGELVITDVGDSEDETQAIAQEGQIVSMNFTTPYQELQVIKPAKFNNLYLVNSKPVDGWQEYYPNPEAPRFAFQYFGEDARFEPSWGGQMILNNGDYLQSFQQIPSVDNFDIYRVKREIFEAPGMFTEV